MTVPIPEVGETWAGRGGMRVVIRVPLSVRSGKPWEVFWRRPHEKEPHPHFQRRCYWETWQAWARTAERVTIGREAGA